MKYNFKDSWSKTKSMFFLQKTRKNYGYLLPNLFIGCLVSVYKLVSGNFEYYSSLEDEFIYWKIFFPLCLFCSILWALFYYNIITVSNKYQIKLFKFAIFCCDVIISSNSLVIGLSLIAILFNMKFEILPTIFIYLLYIEIILGIKKDFQDPLEWNKKIEQLENSINDTINN